MQSLPDAEPSEEEVRIARFKEAMSKIGVEYKNQYLLIASSVLGSPETWQIDWIRPITEEQYRKGQELVDSIMNKK